MLGMIRIKKPSKNPWRICNFVLRQINDQLLATIRQVVDNAIRSNVIHWISSLSIRNPTKFKPWFVIADNLSQTRGVLEGLCQQLAGKFVSHYCFLMSMIDPVSPIERRYCSSRSLLVFNCGSVNPSRASKFCLRISDKDPVYPAALNPAKSVTRDTSGVKVKIRFGRLEGVAFVLDHATKESVPLPIDLML